MFSRCLDPGDGLVQVDGRQRVTGLAGQSQDVLRQTRFGAMQAGEKQPGAVDRPARE